MRQWGMELAAWLGAAMMVALLAFMAVDAFDREAEMERVRVAEHRAVFGGGK